MFDVATITLFLGAAVALVLTPGPDTMYVLARGVERGRYGGVRAASGIGTGVLVHTFAAVVGLSALLRTSAVAYSLVKYAGAAYLVYLGIEAFVADGSYEFDGNEADGGGFRRGVAVNVLNPKVALFFLAFLPQFAGSGPGTEVRMATLGFVYAALTVAYLSGVALLANRVGAAFRRNPRFGRALQWVSGSVFVGLGLRLAYPDRVP